MAEATVRLIGRAADLDASDWQRLAGAQHPFTSHAFITALEDSGSATTSAGWQPVHLVADDADGNPVGLMPGYLKSHSQGEYVFDHGWADAWERAGGHYYPKLQHSVPFTPATGPRILTADAQTAALLVAASETLVDNNGLSSAHATFVDDRDAAHFIGADWLERRDIQYHWLNSGYSGFDSFLGDLQSRKRKVLKRERAEALAAVDDVEWLTGSDLSEDVWDSFFLFYQNTASRKWGRPYLTRAFFSLIGERMGDRIMLVMARRAGRYVAGAINFLGTDCLYGRQWGAVENIPFLHFELCYHQAIDIACHLKLARVEAGAQGEHKLARGYVPVETRSFHLIPNPSFKRAVTDYLTQERALVTQRATYLKQELPFRRES